VTNRDVALLAFKVVGLWLMAVAAVNVAGLPFLWDPAFDDLRAATVAFTLLPVLVAAGIGIPVWFSADWFASRIFPSAPSGSFRPERLRTQPLFALALSVIGVFLICEALPALVGAVSLFLQSRQTQESLLGGGSWQTERASLWNANAKALAAQHVTRLVLGVAFVLGPARLSRALAWFRSEMEDTLEQDGGAGNATPPVRVNGDVEQADEPDNARDEQS